MCSLGRVDAIAVPFSGFDACCARSLFVIPETHSISAATALRDSLPGRGSLSYSGAFVANFQSMSCGEFALVP